MPVFAALEVYHDESTRTAAINMAIDEALLENAIKPAIRFYQWDHPALSFGYFGRYADVANENRDLVRRWTGGGIVFHGQDLTYSVVIPARHPRCGESAKSIYEKIHRSLSDALRALGQEAVVAGDDDAAVNVRGYNGRCFAHPVRTDVLVNGRKVAGAAQRRTRAGLLQQGSIQNVDLANGLVERFASKLCEVCDEKPFPRHVIKRAIEIADRKYATETWLRRR